MPRALLPFAFACCLAQSLTNEALHRRGLDYGYNLDYPEALAAFDAAIAADPNDATAHRLAGATIWMRTLFHQGAITVEEYLGQAGARVERKAPPADLAAAFATHLDRALTLAEARVRAFPNDAEAHFQLGAAAALRTSYLATIEGRVMDSVGTGRRAYNEHKRALALDPTRKDAGLIVGMYRYTTASLPFHMRLMARMAGVEGGRDKGLRLVEEAARHPSNAQTTAMLTLMLILNREGRYGEALGIARELQRRYPRNRLFWLEAGNTALRAGRAAVALDELNEGFARFQKDPRPKATGEEAQWQAARDRALKLLPASQH
jgi:tetratricopeptide (TPR) repeat protein